ncbi:MAG: hypothetical protein HUK26_06900, partial [Duodenibacillus sp.]|nr:hypothetical protein [Duodenibacillus sp.]
MEPNELAGAPAPGAATPAAAAARPASHARRREAIAAGPQIAPALCMQACYCYSALREQDARGAQEERPGREASLPPVRRLERSLWLCILRHARAPGLDRSFAVPGVGGIFINELSRLTEAEAQGMESRFDITFVPDFGPGGLADAFAALSSESLAGGEALRVEDTRSACGFWDAEFRRRYWGGLRDLMRADPCAARLASHLPADLLAALADAGDEAVSRLAALVPHAFGLSASDEALRRRRGLA